MSTNEDVEMAFNGTIFYGDVQNIKRRNRDIEYRKGGAGRLPTPWLIATIAGVLYLDAEQGVHRESDYVLMHLPYLPHLFDYPHVRIADPRIIDPWRNEKQLPPVELLIRPFGVLFDDSREVPKNLRNRVVDMAFTNEHEMREYPLSEFTVCTIRRMDGTIVVVSPPDYRRNPY